MICIAGQACRHFRAASRDAIYERGRSGVGLLDEDLGRHLLEANTNPALSFDGKRLLHWNEEHQGDKYAIVAFA